MRVVVYSMGYRGDVFPYVPIAAELARRGHDVRYVVPREYHRVLSDLPFHCIHTGIDFSPQVLDRHGQYVARWGRRFGGLLVLRLFFVRLTIPYLDEMFDAIDAEVAGADLVVCHPLCAFAASITCERHDVPWVVGDLYPMLLPSASTPPPGLPNLGRTLNRTAWRLGRKLDRFVGAEPFRQLRRRFGLPSREWNMVDGRLSPCLNLGLASPSYVERRDDWPTNYHLVGFTPWSGPTDELPTEVTDYLDRGEPPVVVTLGTSAASAAPDLFQRVAVALDRLQARGMLLTSNHTIAAAVRENVGHNHGVWPYVPLEPLLPHCRAVVHAGGHGTTALVLGAGLPAGIWPCLADQVRHAHRHEELGVGVRMGRHASLLRLLTDTELAERAEQLGRMLARDNGPHTACDLIEARLA